MIQKRFLQALFFLSLLTASSYCHAITMGVTVSGNDIRVDMTAAGPPTTTSGRLAVNFGDGSPVVRSPVLTYVGAVTVVNKWSTTHSYSAGGDYTVTGRWESITAPDPDPPYIVVRQVSILVLFPDKLSVAGVGEEYEELFRADGGTGPYRYRVVSGSLPPGLRLAANGLLSGAPSRLGRYVFSVEVWDARGLKSTRKYELRVDSGEVTIRVTPSTQSVSRQGVPASAITYEYSGTAVQDVLRSSRGEFRVGGTVLGYINKGLTLNVRNGKARSAESVRIPMSVIQRAAQMNSNRISYSREFTSKSIIGRASCTLLVSSSGDLRITRMRLFFEDSNRPRTVVSRSSRDLEAVAEISFTGTGLLKGYWEVDGRILKRVQKNLRFSKKLTLKTPDVPPLPTYAEGPHRVRFVITSPAQGISFPVAYYDVVEDKKSGRRVVVLLLPEDESILKFSETRFSWEQDDGAVTYLVSFFDQDAQDEKPLFSAYSKTKTYDLPTKILEKFFERGAAYKWLVIGLSDDGGVVSESRVKHFRFESSQ